MTAREFWRDKHGVSIDFAKELAFRMYPEIDSFGDIPKGERKSAAFLIGRDHEFHTVEFRNGKMVVPDKNYEGETIVREERW